MAERVEEAVRRGVVAQIDRADERRHRREQHEKVEIFSFGQTMQQPGAGDFGPEHRHQRVGRHLAEPNRPGSRRRMDDAAQRQTGGGEPTEESDHSCFIGDVDRGNVNGRSQLLDCQHASHLFEGVAALPQGRPPFAIGQPRPASQHEMARTLRCEPSCDS